MTHTVMTTSFEDVGEARQIGAHIGMGVYEGIANACLCGQVDDPLRLVFPEHTGDGIPVLKIHAQVGKGIEARGAFKSRLFQRNIVIIIQVVYADDFITAFQQAQ